MLASKRQGQTDPKYQQQELSIIWRGIDRGRRMPLKRRERGKEKLLRLQGGQGGQAGGKTLVVGWAGVVVRRLALARRYSMLQSGRFMKYHSLTAVL